MQAVESIEDTRQGSLVSQATNEVPLAEEPKHAARKIVLLIESVVRCNGCQVVINREIQIMILRQASSSKIG